MTDASLVCHIVNTLTQLYPLRSLKHVVIGFHTYDKTAKAKAYLLIIMEQVGLSFSGFIQVIKLKCVRLQLMLN